MDLRHFSKPTDLAHRLSQDRDRQVMWYQPFVFSDQLVTGSGAFWSGRTSKQQFIATPSDDAELRTVFVEENLRLGSWYDQLVQAAVAGTPGADRFIDLGCNAGHFCFELDRLGKTATGVDIWKDCYSLISQISGQQFEYLNAVYSSAVHRVPELGDRTFDYAICSAIATHLTDPHYFLAYASSIASKGMLYTTPVIESADPVWKLRIPPWRRDNTLPELIEFLPSRPAVTLLLQSLYPHVYHRPYREGDPTNTAEWGVWMAQLEPVTQEVLDRFGFEQTESMLDDAADSLRWRRMPVIQQGEVVSV